ncbi:MAG: hypothetical protein V3S69_06905, partial [Dehalococcoidales bacterium]
MALNIGNVSFGVEANTKGMDKVFRKISQFQKATDKLARSQSTNAKKAVKAMLEREKAIRGAVRETLNLIKAQTKAGADKKAIEDSANRLRILTRALTRANAATVTMTRAQQNFKDGTNLARRELSKLNETVTKGKKGIGKYAILLRDLESSAVLALGPLSGLGSRIRSIGAILGRGGGGFAGKWIAITAGIVGMTIAILKFIPAV